MVLSYFRTRRRLEVAPNTSGWPMFAALAGFLTCLVQFYMITSASNCWAFRCFDMLMLPVELSDEEQPLDPTAYLGVISIEEPAVDLPKITRHLRELQRARPAHHKVLLAVADDLHTQDVIDVVDLCRGLGLEVMLALPW